MIRAVLIGAIAAYASTVSAAPVLASDAGDALDTRMAQLEAKVEALEVGAGVYAKEVSKMWGNPWNIQAGAATDATPVTGGGWW